MKDKAVNEEHDHTKDSTSRGHRVRQGGSARCNMSETADQAHDEAADLKGQAREVRKGEGDDSTEER